MPKKMLNILLFFVCLELISGIGISILSFRYMTMTQEAVTCKQKLNQSTLRIEQWKIESNSSIDNKKCDWLTSQSKIHNIGIYLNESGNLFLEKSFLSVGLRGLIHITNFTIIIGSLIYGMICFYFHKSIPNSRIIFLGTMWIILSGLISMKFNLFLSTCGMFITLIAIIGIEYMLLFTGRPSTYPEN